MFVVTFDIGVRYFDLIPLFQLTYVQLVVAVLLWSLSNNKGGIGAAKKNAIAIII